MKTKLLALCALFLLSYTATLSALAAVPVSEEPLHIVRYRSPHFVIYTNNLGPGESTQYHEHRNDLLAVISGATVAINQKWNDEPGEQRVPAGTVAFFPYADMPNGYVHRISVGGTLPFINVGVDFRDAPPSAERRASLALLAGNFITAIGENRRGRAYRVELSAGQSLALPQQGSAVLLVALGTAQITLEGNDSTAHWNSIQGDFRFFEASWPPSLKNTSTSATSLVIFQAY
jgi:hypothetical protein